MKSKTLKRVLACMLAASLTLPVFGFVGCDDNKGGDSENQCKVTVVKNYTEAGTVTGGKTYDKNDEVTLTAQVNAGYKFVGWINTATNTTLSTDLSYSFTASDNVNIMAQYAKETFNVSVSKDPGDNAGFVTGAGVYEYTDSVQLKSYSAAGYNFDGWYKGTVQVDSSATHNFTMPAENVALTAKWSAKIVNIEYIKNIAAAGTVEYDDDNNGAYYFGDLVTLKATTNPGYKFVGWYDTDGDGNTALSINNEFQITASRDKTYEARWEEIKYKVAVNSNGGEGVQIAGAGNYRPGETVTLVAPEIPGRAWEGWFEGGKNGTSLTQDRTYTFEMGENDTTDRTFYAQWETLPGWYEVNVFGNAEAFETISPSNEYPSGTSVTLTATLKVGYVFLGWYNGSTLLSNQATYTFDLTENMDITAMWDYAKYNVVVNKNYEAAGTVTGEGEYKYDKWVTLTASENPGYTFLGWYDGGDNPVETSKTYQFQIRADKTVEARWEIHSYEITATSSNNSFGTVEGGATYNHGDEVTLKATPKEGYAFKGWYEAGTDTLLSSLEVFTFAAVRTMAVYARFSKSGNLPIPSGNHHIEVRVYSGGYGLGWVEEAADLFEAAYPGYTVSVSGDANMFETLKLELDNNTCPADVALINDAHYRELASKGKLVCLDDVLGSNIAGTETPIEDVIPAAHYTYRDMSGALSGSQYGLPWQDNNAPGIIYNKTFFAQNNLEIPETMAEYIALCQQIISLKKGVTPLTYCGGKSYGYTQNILNQWFVEDVGYDYMNGTFLAYDNVQNFIDTEDTRTKVYGMLANMLKMDGFATSNSKNLEPDQSINEFINGQAAMMICGPWFPTEASLKLDWAPNFDYGFFGIPHINADKMDKTGTIDTSDVRYSLGSNSLVIPNTADEKAVAKLFLAFLYSNEALSSFVEQNNGVSRPMTTTPEVSLDTTTKRGAFSQQVYDYFKGTSGHPTKMIYEISMAKMSQNGMLCPCKTKNERATDGDTLDSIIGADSHTVAMSVATKDAREETKYVQSLWDSNAKNWYSVYLQ